MSRKVIHDGRGSFQIRFPYDRRLVDLVKSLPDRRWNPGEKYWSVPEGAVTQLVEALHPLGFSFDDATRRLYAAYGGTLSLTPSAPSRAGTTQPGLFTEDVGTTEGPAMTSGADDDYTVGRLNDEVRALLEGAFPAAIWLVGEMSGFNKSAHRRHVTFHLVEHDRNGQTLSEVNATLFEGTRREIEAKLSSAGDPFRLEDELAVRLRVRVELYVPWGMYRVVVEDIDIHYTLGEAARRREEIIRRLTEEGVVGRNTALPFPVLPLRVGLITSLDSDAYNDVVRTLQECGFAFRVTAHGARVQGPLTEPSVLNALDWFRTRARRFDVLLICRGGGSRIDLAWFDSAALGRAVALFPVPVVVGIGHEQDQSVLDAVGRRAKTPTAAAGLLVEQVRDALERVEQRGLEIVVRASRSLREQAAAGAERARRLATAARNLLTGHGRELAHRGRRTAVGARAVLQAARSGLERRVAGIPRAALVHTAQQSALLARATRQVVQGARRDVLGEQRRVTRIVRLLGPAGGRGIERERERTRARERRLELVHPARVLARGYAIVRHTAGPIITDPSDAPSGTRLRAQLRGGTLGLRSEGPGDEA